MTSSGVSPNFSQNSDSAESLIILDDEISITNPCITNLKKDDKMRPNHTEKYDKMGLNRKEKEDKMRPNCKEQSERVQVNSCQ